MRCQTIPRENGWEAGAGLVSISPGFLTFTGLLCVQKTTNREVRKPDTEAPDAQFYRFAARRSCYKYC